MLVYQRVASWILKKAAYKCVFHCIAVGHTQTTAWWNVLDWHSHFGEPPMSFVHSLRLMTATKGLSQAIPLPQENSPVTAVCPLTGARVKVAGLDAY